jgi:hypothetical protein
MSASRKKNDVAFLERINTKIPYVLAEIVL